ncbi:MAG: formyltransferase family protein [Pseudobdellovibrionaceae bacterium]
MRILIVIDETTFFHPQMTQKIIDKLGPEVVAACVVTKIPDRSNLERFLMRNWRWLYFSEMFQLFLLKIKMQLLDALRFSRVGSVRSAFRSAKIPFIEIHNNINQPQYLDWIRSFRPDIIVSSNSLYFGPELLSIPTICSLNRHSGLLPSYGGLWPVLQAYRSGEMYTGASVHKMERKIDAGEVLAQELVPIQDGMSLFDLYEQCFDKSVSCLVAAIEKIRKNDFSPVKNNYKSSYYGFPTKEQWREFRRRGGRFI